MDKFIFAVHKFNLAAAFLSARPAFNPFHVDLTVLDEPEVFAEVFGAVVSLLVYFLFGGIAPKALPDLKNLRGQVDDLEEEVEVEDLPEGVESVLVE